VPVLIHLFYEFVFYSKSCPGRTTIVANALSFSVGPHISYD